MNKNSNKKRFLILSGIILVIIFAIFTFFKITNKPSETPENIASENTEDENSNNSQDISDNNSNSKNRFDGLKMTNEDVGVPVLYYHSVLPDSEVTTPNEVTISPEKLKQELQIVHDLGYTTITLSELNDYLNGNIAIPEKSIVITFDDGYTDNYVHAFPILKELNMKATVFMIAAQVDSGYYMSKDQLKEMSDYGIDIGSHTDNHVYLDKLSYDAQLKEMKDSKEKLQNILGKDVISIAYPYGNYNEDTKKAATAAGYTLAFTTNKGLDKRTGNKVELNRIYVSSTYTLETFKERLIDTK